MKGKYFLSFQLVKLPLPVSFQKFLTCSKLINKMKKGLLLALGVTVGICLSAQAPVSVVDGVHKADVTNSKKNTLDGNQVNFFTTASSTQRNSNPTILVQQGIKFSSSYNGLTLLVSQANCLSANQALGCVMMIHRISLDWPADANVNSGYIEYSWTPDYGQTWDSSYVADGLSSQLFRYPNGAMINSPSNTAILNAVTVGSGPYTNGTNWLGYWHNDQQMMNGATQNTSILTTANIGTTNLAFPRIAFESYDDTAAWTTGGLYTDPNSTTQLGQGYRGAALLKAQKAGMSVVWSYDSIKPTFHQKTTGENDTWTDAHIAFSADGKTGYVVFMGVDAAATTPSTRTYSPIVYKSTNSGAPGTWNQLPINDFSTIPVIADRLFPATGGSLKPWFDEGQGSDIMVDNNNQLHIICTIASGSSDDDDSLDYTWGRTGVNGTQARHFIYDTHTTGNGWDSWLIDSLMTTSTTTQSQWTEPAGNGANPLVTDARIQCSHTADHSKYFVVWVDSDPFGASGENALPNLMGRGYDLTTNMYTDLKVFTQSQDFWWHFVSANTLVSGNTYKVGVTNSFTPDNSYNLDTRMDHYFYDQCLFMTTDFTNQLIGVNEQTAALGSFSTYPNPAKGIVNVNLELTHASNINITITNTLGEAVMTENRSLNEGSNLVQLNTSSLSAGVYFVSVSSENSKSTSKIVIQ
jgi:hypothetical protein